MAIAVNPTDVNLPAGDSDPNNVEGQPGTLTSPIGELPAAAGNSEQTEIFRASQRYFNSQLLGRPSSHYSGFNNRRFCRQLSMDGSGSYRSLYPGMVEADRQASYEALFPQILMQR